VESQIEVLQLQEQEISKELWVWETKQKKAERLTNYLDEVNRFSTKFLTEAVEKERNQEQPDSWAWEYLLKNKVEFALKFEPASKTFYELIFQKTESQVSYLKRKLTDLQSQLSHQERIFARLEIRRQGRTLLECEYKKSIGCLGVWKCANCQVNYADNSQQSQEVTSP